MPSGRVSVWYRGEIHYGTYWSAHGVVTVYTARYGQQSVPIVGAEPLMLARELLREMVSRDERRGRG